MELSTDWVPILDPRTSITTEMKMPVKVADVPRSSQANVAPVAWRYWGEDAVEGA